MGFPFEKLDVYQRSLKVSQKVDTLCKELKGQCSFNLLDQLFRAALSISLNIAEGNGRQHTKDKQ